jgi:hypothetical protein
MVSLKDDMGLDVFLQELITKGQVTLTSSEAAGPADLGNAEAALLDLDRRARLEAPGDAPPFSPRAAMWAGRLLHRGCQCFAYRDLEAAEVARDLAEPCPAPSSEPATIWSVDLAFRWLPDLFGLARGVADGDPLLESLRGLALQWPLSSVGVAGLEGVDPQAVLADDCLRRLYVDRILSSGDTSRLRDAGAAEAAREALGLYTDLCPLVARALEATS